MLHSQAPKNIAHPRDKSRFDVIIQYTTKRTVGYIILEWHDDDDDEQFCPSQQKFVNLSSTNS